ncbi:MAG: UDP-N-acetylmuramoyl-L-alanine--D-glutamate ligase [Burkholderiaceae bacterium]|nr:MAG: UDP-N-acetylmuramoyl-L-alanine--D-glutamate ligase [Burkholderiaceae bacterium]
MAKWLTRQGAAVRVADSRSAPPQLASLRAQCPQAEFVGGAFATELLTGCDTLALSPGLSLHQDDIKLLLDHANTHQIAVVGEIELFAQALAQLRATQDYAPKVLAITGTNGKTTTTRLTGLLCERAGKTVAVAGNISPAALDVLAEAMDAQALPEVWVLELSSFQLATTHSLHPDAAAVLNITQDHLDWHSDMADYAAAKERIFGGNTVQVLNADDAIVARMQRDDAQVAWFGIHLPTHPGSFGLQQEGGMRWLVEAVGEEAEKRGRKKNTAPAEIYLNRLMPADALRIRGTHNMANALAALALCRAIGLPMASLLHALRDYAGEPHRVELIATVNEVQYIDDSKGTNVGATVAALEGLEKQVVLIAGGDGKGQDFAPLAAPVQRYARAVLLLGRDALRLRTTLADTGVELIDCGQDETSLPRAVKLAAHKAQPGDAVLLSPACASLDMFRDYAHRASVFAAAVRELALEAGQC